LRRRIAGTPGPSRQSGCPPDGDPRHAGRGLGLGRFHGAQARHAGTARTHGADARHGPTARRPWAWTLPRHAGTARTHGTDPRRGRTTRRPWAWTLPRHAGTARRHGTDPPRGTQAVGLENGYRRDEDREGRKSRRLAHRGTMKNSAQQNVPLAKTRNRSPPRCLGPTWPSGNPCEFVRIRASSCGFVRTRAGPCEPVRTCANPCEPVRNRAMSSTVVRNGCGWVRSQGPAVRQGARLRARLCGSFATSEGRVPSRSADVRGT